jgi:hypothetical protein
LIGNSGAWGLGDDGYNDAFEPSVADKGFDLSLAAEEGAFASLLGEEDEAFEVTEAVVDDGFDLADEVAVVAEETTFPEDAFAGFTGASFAGTMAGATFSVGRTVPSPGRWCDGAWVPADAGEAPSDVSEVASTS